jgi:hypothetical protein
MLASHKEFEPSEEELRQLTTSYFPTAEQSEFQIATREVVEAER